jgi:hypothetical protein
MLMWPHATGLGGALGAWDQTEHWGGGGGEVEKLLGGADSSPGSLPAAPTNPWGVKWK